MLVRSLKWVVMGILLLSGLLNSWLLQPAEACTGIMLRNADETVVHGRTVEFATPVQLTIAIVPRGYDFVGKIPGGTGLKYQAKYGVVGAFTFQDLAIVDGINEKGLAVGVFFFPTYAKYSEINDANRSKALSPTDFSNWIVTQFGTVEEVRSAVERGEVVIAPTVLSNWGPVSPPFHYVVYDKTGASIVIEPVDGKLKVHANPIGVLTNSPTFDWHLTNLRNYIALQPLNVPEIKIDGIKLREFGLGNGMLGIPGDFSPPSRFVRAAIFCSTAIPSSNSEQGIQQVFHILNNFDIPRGVSREKSKDRSFFDDYTQYTCARDPQKLRYYLKSYEDQTIRMVELGKFDLNAKKVKTISTSGVNPPIDVSAEAK